MVSDTPPHQDAEMTDPDSPTQSDDRNSLRQWLTEGVGYPGQLITAGLKLGGNKLSLQSLKLYINQAKDVFPGNFPAWLDVSLKNPAHPAVHDLSEDISLGAEELIWKTLHVSHPRDSSGGSSSSKGFSSESKAKILHGAFTADYRGDAPTRFCKILSTGYIPWYRAAKHHGRIIAAIQSSATGKTRLYYHIGEKHIPTFALCFREFSDEFIIDPSEGWPYGDRALVQYFTPSTAHTSEEIAAAFLGQLYKALARSAHEVGIDCFAHLAPSLHVTMRESFLHDVCSMAREELTFIPRGDDGSSAWCSRLFKHYVEQHANQLGTKLRGRTLHPGAEFLLIIDECAQLDKLGACKLTGGNTDSTSFLTGLRRIAKAGDQSGASSGFWMVLLDTHGETYTSYPISRERASSARLVDGTHVALPPWIDLGLDYWDRLHTSIVLTEAATKLFCGDPDREDLKHVIAVMSRRIHLPLNNDSTNTKTHLVAVEKHMRYMTSIGWEDGMVTTAALSEPVLSIAAASTLLASPAAYSALMGRFLDKVLINEHLVERGRLGETLASVVLIIARDAATCTFLDDHEYESTFVSGTTQQPSVKPVTATRFIESLFPEVLAQFESFGNDAWISFSHFDILPSILDGEIPMKLLLNAWCRNVAFQCADNQPIYDLLIPMYLGDLHRSFEPAKLSYIVVQIKARVGAPAKGPLESLTGPMIDIGSGPHKPPYLAILMDLGTLVAFQGLGPKKVYTKHTAAILPQKTTSASILGHYTAQEPVRWVFHARGFTEETYPSLPKFGARLMHRVLYGRAGEEDEGEGREVVRSAAADWREATSSILTKGC
ncbi:hypothetical protein B0H17DRAFT_1211230 [Mycena rosella]|uniref:Uncharacterized protein n=1 Tax=Mycena rosella TaxID=1033263 RepID=A0AAD7G7J3_MYCRO|nr:hypothetical protein B0H17DRAFT_1211230 [Mycena rosella]